MVTRWQGGSPCKVKSRGHQSIRENRCFQWWIIELNPFFPHFSKAKYFQHIYEESLIYSAESLFGVSWQGSDGCVLVIARQIKILYKSNFVERWAVFNRTYVAHLMKCGKIPVDYVASTLVFYYGSEATLILGSCPFFPNNVMRALFKVSGCFSVNTFVFRSVWLGAKIWIYFL